MTTPDEIDDLEFSIVKENWNSYEFKDGTKLKGRIFLTRLAEKKNAKPPTDLKSDQKFGEYSISAQNNFQIFAQPHQKSKPTLPLPVVKDINPQDQEEVEIITSNEPWNVYEVLKNGLIVRIKLVVSEVFRVKGAFDQFGQPYYIVKSAPVFDYKPPTRKEKFA